MTAAKLRKGAVTSGKLAQKSVVAGKLGPNAVLPGNIGNGAVTTAKIGAGAVIASSIKNGVITTNKLNNERRDHAETGQWLGHQPDPRQRLGHAQQAQRGIRPDRVHSEKRADAAGRVRASAPPGRRET